MKKLTRIQLERDAFFFSGSAAEGACPLKYADPQVRRAGRRGETERGKLWLGRLGKGFRGLGAAGVHLHPELNWGPQIFEEHCAISTTFASGLLVAPSSSPKAHFRSPGKHSEHVLTQVWDPGKVVPA